jgi:hypothetical protein
VTQPGHGIVVSKPYPLVGHHLPCGVSLAGTLAGICSCSDPRPAVNFRDKQESASEFRLSGIPGERTSKRPGANRNTARSHIDL